MIKLSAEQIYNIYCQHYGEPKHLRGYSIDPHEANGIIISVSNEIIKYAVTVSDEKVSRMPEKKLYKFKKGAYNQSYTGEEIVTAYCKNNVNCFKGCIFCVDQPTLACDASENTDKYLNKLIALGIIKEAE